MKRIVTLCFILVTLLVPGTAASQGIQPPSRPYCDPSECYADPVNPGVSYNVESTWTDEGEDDGWSYEVEPGTLSIISCKWSTTSVYTSDPTHTIVSTRSKIRWHWCWNGIRVTKIDSAFAWSSWSLYPIEYQGIDSGPTYERYPRSWAAQLSVQFHYAICPLLGWDVVCVKSVHPWLIVHLYGNGWYGSEAGGWILDS